VLIVFTAGIVRGFAGFGFSALSVAGMSLLLPPAQVVPPVFVLEVLASLSLLREAWKDADLRWLQWLVLGNALCIPLGLALLVWLPEVELRLVLGGLLLLAAALLRAGFSLGLEPSWRVKLGTGLVSGFVNGVAAIGGIAVAVLMSTTALAPAAMRATMIVLFLFTDLYALVWAAALPAAQPGGAALLGPHTLMMALGLAPAMLAGIWCGRRAFAGLPPQTFRQRVLEVLIVIASLGVLRAVVDRWG
jgi:uncharacterized membrane protein YfcA